MQTYTMVGAGGTGTHLFHPLVTYLRARHTKPDDQFQLVVIDGDTVEQKNLERQLFDATQVTANKAEALTATAGDSRIYPVTEYLSEDNIEGLVQEGDIVLICVDNFTVRKRIEERARQLQNVTVINGGNEESSGSVQLWIRKDGENVTPAISFLHPEVAIKLGDDRAEMTCAQAAALPGGSQTIIANMQSATWMLTALWRFHEGLDWLAPDEQPSRGTWTELQFDARAGTVDHIDMRMCRGWQNA